MNLGEFKSLLDRYLKRLDLQDIYNDWVAFTSSRIDQQLRLPEQEQIYQFTPTSEFTDLPADFIEARHVKTSADGGWPLRYVTPTGGDIADLLLNSSGRVTYYSIMDRQIQLIPAPVADSVAVIDLWYYAKLPVMTQDSQTNAVLTAYPQLYLYGCMMEAAAFRKDDQDNANYAQLWRDYAKELNDRAQAARFSGDTLRMRAV